jgi:hypothetical protein
MRNPGCGDCLVPFANDLPAHYGAGKERDGYRFPGDGVSHAKPRLSMSRAKDHHGRAFRFSVRTNMHEHTQWDPARPSRENGQKTHDVDMDTGCSHPHTQAFVWHLVTKA